MFHMQERQFSLSLLFKKPVQNAVRPFSCFRQIIEAALASFGNLIISSQFCGHNIFLCFFVVFFFFFVGKSFTLPLHMAFLYLLTFS